MLEAECKQLIAAFLSTDRPVPALLHAEVGGDGRRQGRRPGRRADADQRPRGPAGPRTSCGPGPTAIVVGVNTVLTDDPLLTAGWRCSRTGRRSGSFWTARSARRSASQLVSDGRAGAGTSSPAAWPRQRRPQYARLAAAGVDVLADAGPVAAACRHADVRGHSRRRRCRSDAGGRAFIEERLADRVWLLRCAAVGDPTAPAAAAVPDHFVRTGTLDLDGDRLTEYLEHPRPRLLRPRPLGRPGPGRIGPPRRRMTRLRSSRWSPDQAGV